MLTTGTQSTRGRSEPSNSQPTGARTVTTPARTRAASKRIRTRRTRDPGPDAGTIETSNRQTHQTGASQTTREVPQ